MLERRGDAAVQQAGREGRHVLGGPRRHGREAAVLRSDEGSGDARHVRHRRQVDVDPEPLERRRRVVPTAADRGLAETAQLLGRGARRRPAEPSHRAALLVGHHEERIAADGGRGSERGRERAHLRGVADVRAHQDHPADLSAADPREERRGGRRAVDPHDEARAHELRERGRRRVGRRGRAGCEPGENDGCGEGEPSRHAAILAAAADPAPARGGLGRELGVRLQSDYPSKRIERLSRCRDSKSPTRGAPEPLRGPFSSSTRTENGSRQSSSASPSIVRRHS